MLDHIPKQKHGLRVKHVNLFDFVLDYLKSRKLLDKAIQMQREKGDRPLKNALAGPLHESELGALFAEAARPDQHDLVIVSGVGTVWPLFRTHSLLNNLQPVMGKTPLVVFYPGRYDSINTSASSYPGISKQWISRRTPIRPEPAGRSLRAGPRVGADGF